MLMVQILYQTARKLTGIKLAPIAISVYTLIQTGEPCIKPSLQDTSIDKQPLRI